MNGARSGYFVESRVGEQSERWHAPVQQLTGLNTSCAWVAQMLVVSVVAFGQDRGSYTLVVPWCLERDCSFGKRSMKQCL